MRGGECFERGLRPLSLFTPLTSQENFSFIFKGTGWRGVHPEGLP